MENNNVDNSVQNPVVDTPAVDAPVINIEAKGETDTALVEQPATQESTEETPKKEKGKKMDLKTLFLLGLGVVAILAAAIIIVVNFTGKKLTVTFDTDGGSKIASVTIKKGKKLSKPKDPTKDNYTFIEWQLDGKKYDFNKEVTKSIKLKAKWEIELTDDVYTITFNTNGGTIIESQSVNGNGKVVKPEDPTKPHCKFMGWKLNDEDYDFETLVKEDITLSATWETAPSYTVTIDFDGGSKNYNQVVYEGEVVKAPEAPKRLGYKFVEWQKDGQTYNFETPVMEDFTIKAKYEEVPTVVVSFDLDGGTSRPAITAQKVAVGEVVVKPNDPVKEGYTFAGWQLEGKDYDMNTPVEKDITLTAKWTESETKMCKVTLNDNYYSDQHKQKGIENGTMATLQVKCGTKITLEQLKNAAKDYCNKALDKPDCLDVIYFNNSKYDFNSSVNEDIVLWSGE